jgi:hypothetical protein
MEITLSGGRSIHLVSARQHSAMGRVLEGPGISAASLLRGLRARAGAGSGCFFAEPNDGWPDSGVPAIQCEATFESQPTSGSHEDYSRLTVVWLQVDFGFPPLEQYVLESLRTLDWDHYAVNSMY